MARILIVAHAPLASALLQVAQHVFPECGVGLRAVDVVPDASGEDVQAQVQAALGEQPALEVLILTDVFGATPCNAALAVADGVRSRIVAGVNVPMLWRTLCYQDDPLDDLVNRAVAGAGQGVMHVTVPKRQNQPAANPAHDQVQHHHLQ